MKAAGAAEANKALGACEAFCGKSDLCAVCSVDCSLGSMSVCQWVALTSCGSIDGWAGLIPGDISTKGSSGNATITLSGPSDAWFAVGLNAIEMSDMPYTIVVNDTGATERKLGTCGSEADHCPGTVLAASLTLLSNTVVKGTRTVVLKRPFQGATADHYSFGIGKDSTIKFISAVGNAQAFAYHKAHGLGLVTLTETGAPTCVCDAGANGKMCELGGKNCDTFVKNCVKDPMGSLDGQHNPTCNSAQYSGGLRCCHHGRLMLDQAQAEVSLKRATLKYHMKFRFWFQEYKNASVAAAEILAVTAKAPAETCINDDGHTPCGSTAQCCPGLECNDCMLQSGKCCSMATDAPPPPPVPWNPSPTDKGPSHYDLPRIYYQTEANAGEYDVIPAFKRKGMPEIPGYPRWPEGKMTPGTTCTGTCPDGPDCDCTHTIHYKWSAGPFRLMYAGGHCHAPSCLGLWLYRNDTGHEMELLCHQAPIYGQGDVHNNKYDEAGYVTLPPCVWGDDRYGNKEGLVAPILLPKNTAVRRSA